MFFTHLLGAFLNHFVNQGVMAEELNKWQLANKLCVSDVNIRLANVVSLGGPKHNVVTGVSVDLDNEL
ncbi:hypothetical protein ACGTGP_18210 [Acinetobacter baumannii]|uniref:hypothetical protein n=1 Tax=Acinetobacter baumannii TaxID=470 RepID=UPI003747DED5